MIACRCDRCKKYFDMDDGNFVSSIIIRKESVFNNTVTDKEKKHLCDSCSNELKLWLKGKNDLKDETVSKCIYLACDGSTCFCDKKYNHSIESSGFIPCDHKENCEYYEEEKE